MMAFALALLVLASCAASQPAVAPTASPLASALEYRRTGGLAGVDDRITVTREGLLEVRKRQGGRATAQLSPGDLKELASLLSGWRKLPSRGDLVSADVFIYSITYDGVTVTAVEFSRAPQAFDLVRKRLEGMAERAR